MSCGLGAIVLVFILVKPGIAVMPVDETKRLSVELGDVKRQEKELANSIVKTKALSAKERKRIRSINAEVTRLQNELSKYEDNLAQHEARVSAIKKSIVGMPTRKSSDIISSKNIGEEEYLLGLTVEGDRIGFLIDVSSSMTDEYLIDIIKRKSGADKIKKDGPKWIRTKKIARWLLSRLPKSSQISVGSYGNNARFLGGAEWHSANDPDALSKILQELDDTVPSGATNLHKGLMKMRSLRPMISNLYIITDGLPTTGQSNFSALNPFSSCFSLLGRANTISGECRAKLFRQTVLDSSLGRNIPVNVILLPLEGDPEASPNYWAWTSATGGLLISPARDWP